MARRDTRRKGSAPASTGGGEGTTKQKKPGGRGAWRLLDRGSTVAAGLLAREASTLAWRAATGRKPPVAGRHPDVETKEAVAWAVVGGAIVELVKLLVRRWAAGYWVRSTGNLPPGMKPVKPSVAPLEGATSTLGTTKEPAPSQGPAPDVRPRRGRRGRRVAQ